MTNGPAPMWRAVSSAEQERSVGLGAMGFHLYLQKVQVPFESPMAVGLNMRIFEHISTKCLDANLRLGCERGEAPDAVGSGRRFSHMMAIAPNANISVLCGNTSPSIEPYSANAFTQKTMSGDFPIRNKSLDNLLQKSYGLSGEALDDVWSSIVVHRGSIQHLKFIDDLHKDLYKTAMEIDQSWIIEHAAVRQKYVCQGQSVNLYLPTDVHKNELHKLHFQAWKKGLKSLYYLRSTAIRKTSAITQNAEVDFSEKYSDCVACEG
jgi:ribonucleoside-diphosphate reductase alpha chain